MSKQLRLRDGEVNLPEDNVAAANFLADIVRNGGAVQDYDTKMTWNEMYHALSPLHTNDAIATPDVRGLLRTSLDVIIREPLEPLANISGLFTRIKAEGLNTQVLAGATGPVTAADIGEGSTVPEVMWQLGGAMQTVKIGKSGLACSFTDEALRYSTWDLMALNLRKMGVALVRHKEVKAASFLRQLGTPLFDNANPSSSMFGVCTGRAIDLATGNGSCTMDDLFKAMAFMAEQGYPVDTVVLSPMMFYQWLQDPALRNMLLAYGGGAFINTWQGNAGPRDPWSNGSMGGMGPAHGNVLTAPGNAASATATGITGREHGMTSVPVVPGYFPWNLRFVPSPFVPFDAENMLSDIYLISSGYVGYHLVDQEPVQTEWRDESVGTVKVKVIERYAFAVIEDGLGIGVMKNVVLKRNYWDGGIKAMSLDVAAEIDATTALV